MNISEIKNELERLERRYQEWAKPINQVIQQGLSKVNRDGYTFADYEREVKEITEKQRAKYDPDREIEAFLDKLCPMYLSATSQDRAQVRAAVSNKSGVQSALLGYVYSSAKRIKSPGDAQWLRAGLAAVSIENCANDFRDVLVALAEIYVTAERAGIDPNPHFKDVASLSSTEQPRGGDTPVAEMLAEFHKYAVLKERREKSQ